MAVTLMTLANDGHGEPSIWATIEYEDSDGSPDDEPICVLQRCDLPMNARPFWPTIVARLVFLEEEGDQGDIAGWQAASGAIGSELSRADLLAWVAGFLAGRRSKRLR